MLDGIGDANGKEGYRFEIYNNGRRKEVLSQDSEFEHEKTFAKMAGLGGMDQSTADAEESTMNRISLENGLIKIETYTENGELVKITPPGYLPLDKSA
jgi:hypothetical protein